MTSNVKFSTLVTFFELTAKEKKPLVKRRKFRKFIDHYCNPIDYFSAIRLILPSLDRERGNYGLKEANLALSLVDALGMSRDSEDAKKIINWRKGGAKIAGSNAGNFALVAVEVLKRRQSSVSSEITIGEVNELLDRLASGEKKSKSNIIGEMIRKTNWQEMKWLIRIIVKDVKLGMSEKTIFDEFHPDAEDVFNVTCDLRLICEKLNDKNVRHKRQDIEVGKAVVPQRADRANTCAEAWKRLQGKEVVVECKFDGDRMQVHKNGSQVNYFSKNFKEHCEYAYGMSNVIVENVLADKCILDGEMLVWNSEWNRFARFGKNQETAKEAREGIVSEHQLCYVVFDVLYVGDSSVIHQTLKERQTLLKKVVRPVKGRLVALSPNGSSSISSSDDGDHNAGEICWSVRANCLDDAEKFYRYLIDNRYEGVILKDLGSKWEPGDRNSRKWLKVKPDYVNAGSDLDVLIIGGYYGSGRRGGEVGQFLVGLAEKPASDTYPRRFLSFCRVGTGLNDEELDVLVTKLKPYFIKYDYPKKSAPSFYQVTNHAKERPDVWVGSPEKSVILSITSDIRIINSSVFAAPYSLRFPRIDRVRYDKPWHECLDVKAFVDLVNSCNGTTQRGEGDAEGLPGKKHARKNGGKKRLALTVPSHFAQTDVSSVKGESQIFLNLVFHFVNVPSGHSLNSMHTLVVENGGTFSMNLNNTVTHCIGAQCRGLKFEAAKRRGSDVIHYSWVLDSCSQKQLLPLKPTYFIFLSESSRKNLKDEIDEFLDPYFWDLSVVELKQIFGKVNRSEDAKTVDYYKKKYCTLEKWCRFHGCSIYFHLFANFDSPDWEFVLKIAMRRMKVEVSFGGGKVSDNPSQATHVVIMSSPDHRLEFETFLQSFPDDQKHIFHRKRLHVVGSQWLEDCFKEQQKLPEVAYSLKPATLVESISDEEEQEYDKDHEAHSSAASAFEEKPMKPASETVTHTREPERKRGRPIGTSTRKGKAVVTKPPLIKRARVASRPAKLQVASDDEINEQETDAQEKATPELEMYDHVFQDISSDDKPNKMGSNTHGKSYLEAENIELGSRLELSEKNKESEEKHEPELNEIGNRRLNNPSISCIEQDKATENPTPGNLDVTFDPVQEMLLNMLPSLRGFSEAKNTEVKSTVSEECEDKSLSSTQSQEGSSVEPSQAKPVKKKKVSYRELARQLLKD